MVLIYKLIYKKEVSEQLETSFYIFKEINSNSNITWTFAKQVSQNDAYLILKCLQQVFITSNKYFAKTIQYKLIQSFSLLGHLHNQLTSIALKGRNNPAMGEAHRKSL